MKGESATTVAQSLYKFICRQCFFENQIKDQGREFITRVNTEVHKVIGVEQINKSAYHPQSKLNKEPFDFATLNAVFSSDN